MSKEKKIVPELRFLEFANDGNWDNEELGNISEIVRGGSPRPIQDYLTTSTDGLNWLKIADVPSDSKYITRTKERVKKEAISSTREVNPGDLILSNSMSFGRPYILKIKTCIHDGWIAIRKISNKTFEDYLYYFISSESSQSYFLTNAAGAAVKNLNAEIIKRLPIFFAKNKKEQQKIASCLSSLDDLIEAHRQKLVALKDHKKGLMQNLFPQEGEKVPKFRFPEFESDGEWEEKNILDIATMKARIGWQNLRKEEHLDKGDFFLVTGTDFKNNKVDWESAKFVSYDRYIQDENIILKEGDVLITKDGSIGKVAFVENLKNRKSTLNNGIFRIRVTNKYPKLVFYSFLSERFTLFLQKLSGGSSIKHLYQKDFVEYEIILPPTLKEQQKVASCLTAIDNLIIAQTEKIEQLKEHKKGLMQGLFPK